jgi:hypothetical protein
MKPNLYIDTYEPYTPCNAGVRTLHYLGAMLEAAEIPVVCSHQNFYNPRTIVRDHIKPDEIAVYPDATRGNPFNAKRICRWMLYYAEGLFGGDRIPKEEAVIVCHETYLWSIRAHCDHPIPDEDVVSIPTLDPTWCFPQAKTIENVVYYAQADRKKFKPLPFEYVEVPPLSEPLDRCHAQSLALMRRAKNFFCFHNSTMAQEAALCGCNVYRVFEHGIESQEGIMTLAKKFSRNPATDPALAKRFAERVYSFFGL